MDAIKLHALDPLLNPLPEDMLHLESSFVEHFYSLVTESIEPPLAVSIDGLWGTGKTTVMQMLKNKLEKENYPIFWFNPWEYSQTESVVLAFLQCLAAEYRDRIEELEKRGKKIFQVLLKAGLGAALKIYTKGNVSLKTVEQDLKEIEEGQKYSYEEYQNSIETIKEEFVDLIDRISRKHDDKPVIIFFDDLDRCLPDDAIRLLEALKNLFIVSIKKDSEYKACKTIFICGIDTRVAKQFIKKHYHELEETFAINYFRKIFNLTVSMPYGRDIDKLLQKYIEHLYCSLDGWDDPDNTKAHALSTIIYNLGVKAKLSSVRKYLNIVHNFYLFQKFNPKPTYEFKPEEPFIIFLLILKEVQQPLYELLVQESLQNDLQQLETIVKELLKTHDNELTSEEKALLSNYVLDESLHFHDTKLSKWLREYPTLA